MAEELANEIADLKRKIDALEVRESNADLSKEERSELNQRIITARGTLNRLLDQQAAQQGRFSLNWFVC